VAAYDFSSPFSAARIIDRDGNAWPLWVNIGGENVTRPSVPGAEDLQALSWVEQVEVKLDLSGVPVITVQLSPPFHEGMMFLDSELINSVGENVIEVQLGYARGTSNGQAILTPPFAGVILNPQVSIDMDIQITLTGQGTASFSTIRQGGRAVSLENTKRREIIRTLARGAGRNIDVNFDSADRNQQCHDLLEAVSPGFVQGGRTDWVALWQLARQTRCWMSVQGNTLYWLSYAERFARRPTRTYRLFNFPSGRVQGMTDDVQNQLAEGELPILSFSCDTDSVWLPASQFGVFLREVSERNREAVDRFVSPQSEANVALGEGSETSRGTTNMPINDQTHEGSEHRPGNPEDEDDQNQIASEIQQGANLGVSLTLEVPGDPSVLPGHTVRLAGLGRRFDGMIYAVQTVTHSVGSGGFTTNLALFTNVNSAISEVMGGRAPAGETNTQQTDTTSETTVTTGNAQEQTDR
jgi:hypothetical protein